MRAVGAFLIVVVAGCGSTDVTNGDLSGADLSSTDDGPVGGGGGDGGGSSCTPSCAGKSCGDDGCGGMCGVACPQNQLCQAGACVNAGTDPIEIDGAALGGAIHPEIYGMAFAPQSLITSLKLPLDRWGGNGTTRYNWLLDVHNSANDYYFENIVNDTNDGYGTPAYAPTSDQQIVADRAAGAATLMTIPTIGWTPKDRVPNHPFTCGYPVSKYGPQQSVDPYDTNCGNGKTSGGTAITGDPTNTSYAAPPSFEQTWLQHMVSIFGTAATGGVKFYQLDNEMNLWGSTHVDVHPMPVTYDEVWSATSSYAPVIRSVDPTATILGYTSWGVLDLFESALDTANNNKNDQSAHGSLPLAEWYLKQLAGWEKTNGSRLVDCLDLHYYPQGGDPLQNTRSLWDATYHDPSWLDGFLGEPVQLFPRLAGWIAAQYPGTSVCVSEYNFNLNNESDPLAALVEADVLGIFGKYGVRLAAYWTTPTDSMGKLLPPGEAFRAYLNYDGAGGKFGGTSVGAATSLPNVSVYAATDGKSLTVMVINKATSALSTTLGIANFPAAASAHVYQYVATAGATLGPLADLPIASGKISLSMPASSMDLIVIPKM
jgi:hypothetical protein